MRRLLVLALPLNLAGCGLIMPSPDPDQAWIAFAPQQRGALEAARVDERPLEDDRYFQVQPGRHALEVRYRFDVDGSAIGTAQPSLARTCLLTLDYADFAAGQRYEMRAGRSVSAPGCGSTTSASGKWPAPVKAAAVMSERGCRRAPAGLS